VIYHNTTAVTADPATVSKQVHTVLAGLAPPDAVGSTAQEAANVGRVVLVLQGIGEYDFVPSLAPVPWPSTALALSGLPSIFLGS
jgi:hypothetical protein